MNSALFLLWLVVLIPIVMTLLMWRSLSIFISRLTLALTIKIAAATMVVGNLGRSGCSDMPFMSATLSFVAPKHHSTNQGQKAKGTCNPSTNSDAHDC